MAKGKISLSELKRQEDYVRTCETHVDSAKAQVKEAKAELPPEASRAPATNDRPRLMESAWFENMACEETIRRLAGWFDGQGAPAVAGAMLRVAADGIRLRRDLTSTEDQYRLGRPR